MYAKKSTKDVITEDITSTQTFETENILKLLKYIKIA